MGCTTDHGQHLCWAPHSLCLPPLSLIPWFSNPDLTIWPMEEFGKSRDGPVVRNGHSEEEEDDFTMFRSPNFILASWFILVNHGNSDFCYHLKGTQVIKKSLELEWAQCHLPHSYVCLSGGRGLQGVAWLQMNPLGISLPPPGAGPPHLGP